MGKRDTSDTRPASATELKRSKRKIHSRYSRPEVEEESNSSKTVEKNEEIVEDNDIQVEQEEEVVYDGEVDMYSNDGIGENIDVETADGDDTDVTTLETVSPVKSTSSTIKSKSNKKSTCSNRSNNSSIIAQELSNSPTTTASQASLNTSSNANLNKKSRKRRDSGTSSDEERWLTAIESGKLEDVDDELKKIKDPKLMTARQRAMYERNSDRDTTLPGGEMLMSLPIGYREREKPQTAEDIQKAVLKSQRRKQQADEKREKDKKKTMERLLKKQESKQRASARSKQLKTSTPMITYINNAAGATVNLPLDFEFPLQAQKPKDPPKIKLCGIAGCGNLKVYNCSKTNMPLCSLECYRKNVQSVKEIMC